jgi:NADH-quinone oxidoreductase subunit E
VSYDAARIASLQADFAEIQARYPRPRSALLPMLHLVQSVEGYVSPDGVELCAASLGLAPAEVSAVATFYTQFRPRPGGTYCLGVCTTALCAIMGGDAIFERLADYLGLPEGGVTPDGLFTLERVECNAACDYAPVMMVNWEFFDNQTPGSATAVVDALRTGQRVAPSRGPSQVGTLRQVERTLAGFPDGLADEGPSAGPQSLAGLDAARERGWVAASGRREDTDVARATPTGGANTPSPTGPAPVPQPEVGGPNGTGGTASSERRRPRRPGRKGNR